jgi:preprotein translocase SecE subunit
MKEVVVEMRKVTWTKPRELLSSTAVVIFFSLLVAVLIWIFDLIFSWGLTSIIH